METSIIITLISTLIAFFSAFCLYFSVKSDYNIAKVRLYIDFQNQFKNFQSKLPADINKKDSDGNYNWKSQDDKDRRLIESYWWLVFDEWLACKKISKLYKSLWKHYEKGVLDALERKEFRDAFERLVKNQNSFMGYDKEFCNTINAIYREKHNTDFIEFKEIAKSK